MMEKSVENVCLVLAALERNIDKNLKEIPDDESKKEIQKFRGNIALIHAMIADDEAWNAVTGFIFQ